MHQGRQARKAPVDLKEQRETAEPKVCMVTMVKMDWLDWTDLRELLVQQADLEQREGQAFQGYPEKLESAERLGFLESPVHQAGME